MRKKMFGIFVWSLVLFFLFLGMNTAWAKYPERKIKLICAWAVGGGTDVMARTLTRYVNPYLEGRVYVENITGATGLIAMREILNAAPDGYTIKMLATTNTVAPHFIKDYPTVELLDPICITAEDPMILAVNPESRFKTPQELIAFAKANPGKLTCATAGHGTPNHLAGAALATAIGAQFSYVPYKGSAPALLAAAGKHVDFATSGGSEAIPLAEGKKVKPLISFSVQRSRLYPDAPTARELGYDIVISRWMGVGAPKGLPKEVKAILVEAFKKALENDEFKKFILQNGMDPVLASPEEAAIWLKKQNDYFRSVTTKAGIQPE